MTSHAPPLPDAGSREPASARAGGRERWRPQPWWPLAAAWAIVAVGVVARLVQYLSGRSLWFDESLLWLNLDEHSVSGLLGPLDFAQGAPIPFLLAEKGAIGLFGDAEWSLRLVPLLAGLAALPLAVLVARRLLRSWEVPLAVGLVALSDHLVYYASETKQYSVDLSVALALLLLGAWALERPLTARVAVWLGLAGAAALWCSDPAVFVLAGLGVTLLGRAALRRDRRGTITVGVVGATWLASFGILYLVHVRDLGEVRVLSAGDGPRTAADVPSVLSDLLDLLQAPLGLSPRIVVPAAVIMLVGIAGLWRRGPVTTAALLALPVVALLIAVMAGQYPIGEPRFGVFLVPVAALLAAAGVGAIVGLPMRAAPVAAGVAAAALLAAPAWATVHLIASPLEKVELAPVVAYVADHREPGDTIYLYPAAQYPMAYYGPRDGIAVRRIPGAAPPRPGFGPTEAALESGDGVVVGTWSDDPATQARDVDRLRGAGRVWLIVSQPRDTDGTDIGRLILRRAARYGPVLDEVQATQAFAVLVDMR